MPFSRNRKPTLRSLRVNVRLSPRERVAVDRRAAAVGMPVSTYVREVGLGRKPRARRRYIDRAVMAQFSGLGSNLRQLRRVAWEAGDIRAVEAIDALYEHVATVARALLRALHPDR